MSQQDSFSKKQSKKQTKPHLIAGSRTINNATWVNLTWTAAHKAVLRHFVELAAALIVVGVDSGVHSPGILSICAQKDVRNKWTQCRDGHPHPSHQTDILI